MQKGLEVTRDTYIPLCIYTQRRMHKHVYTHRHAHTSVFLNSLWAALERLIAHSSEFYLALLWKRLRVPKAWIIQEHKV